MKRQEVHIYIDPDIAGPRERFCWVVESADFYASGRTLNEALDNFEIETDYDGRSKS